MIPKKLKPGDEIRIISPSRSLSLIAQEQRDISIKRLNEIGLKVTFSRNSEEVDEFISSSVESRIEDLHEAFRDKSVKGILTTIGGFNSNQLLSYIDYSIIKDNPKVLCGFSDITALSNAIYAKTVLIGYSGPHFSTFGMIKRCEYIIEYFKRCLMEEGEFEVNPSETWSDDTWFIDQENRSFIENEGPFVINTGAAEGTIIGGNLCTLNLLQGTEFMPALKNSILFIEDDEMTIPEIFDRDLQSLIHQKGFEEVRGIVIGRFQRASKITREKLIRIIKTKRELNNIPVAADLDFGHTTPRFSFPIGGRARVEANGDMVKLVVLDH
jgi:muramoyltetrapeptide carboxypeptidase